MTEEISEDVLTNALQGDRESILAVRDRLNGVSTPSAEQLAVAAGRRRADYLRNVDKLISEGDYSDLAEDPKIWSEIVEGDKVLLEQYPNATDEARAEALFQTARRNYGTEASRVILEKKNQQRAARGETPLEYVIPEQPDQFDVDQAKDHSEAIAEMRRGRGGVPLSEIRARRRGAEPAETDGES